MHATLGLATMACFVAGVLSGCGLFSGEVASGTLTFLTMLPITRPRIWRSKVGAGLLTLGASIAGIGIAGAVIMLSFAHSAISRIPYLSHSPLDLKGAMIASMAGAAFTGIGCFIVALVVSLLLDRTLTSAIVSIAACLGIPLLISGAVNAAEMQWPSSHGYWYYAMELMSILAIPSFLGASFYIFVHGETLRTTKRFILLAKALSCWASINIMVLAAAYTCRWAI